MKKLALTTIAASLSVLPLMDAQALPINPLIKTPALHGLEDLTLAYDSVDDKLIYFAPDQYKVATSEGGIAHAGLVEYTDDDGNTVFEINAQFESHLTGTDLHRATSIIEAAGFKAAPLPLTYTHLKPAMIDYNGDRQDFCSMMFDEDEGDEIMVCSDLWDKVRTRDAKDPAVQGNLWATARLSPEGMAAFEDSFLTGDLGFTLDGESKFYQAGTAWTAVVHVNYSVLLSAYHDFIVKKGKKEHFVSANFLREEILCATGYGDHGHGYKKEPGKQCGVTIEYFDCWGQRTKGPDIDPTNDDHRYMAELVTDVATKLENELYGVVYDWSPQDNWGQGDIFVGEFVKRHSKPKRGVVISQAGYKYYKEINRSYTFRADANTEDKGRLYAPASIECLTREAESGEIVKNKAGACAAYWADNPCHGFECENEDEVCVVKVVNDIPGTKCVPAPVIDHCEYKECPWGTYCVESGKHAGHCKPIDPVVDPCPDGCADDEYCVVDANDNSECKPKYKDPCMDNECDPVTQVCTPDFSVERRYRCVELDPCKDHECTEDETCTPDLEDERGYQCVQRVMDPCEQNDCAADEFCAPSETDPRGFKCVDNCGMIDCKPTEVCKKDADNQPFCEEVCAGVDCNGNQQCFGVNGTPECQTACQRMPCPDDTICKDDPTSFARECKNPCELTECDWDERCEWVPEDHKAVCVPKNPCKDYHCHDWRKVCKVDHHGNPKCVKRGHGQKKWWPWW